MQYMNATCPICQLKFHSRFSYDKTETCSDECHNKQEEIKVLRQENIQRWGVPQVDYEDYDAPDEVWDDEE